LIMARSKEMTGKDLPGIRINNAEYNLVLDRGEERDDIETFYPIFLKKSSNDDGFAPDSSSTTPTSPPVGDNVTARSPLPLPAGTRTVRIISALVNPTGRTDEGENVTLLNIGSSDVDLDKWKLRDGNGRNLDLKGVLKIGHSKTFIVDKSRNNSFTLTNKKNDITLVSSVTVEVIDNDRVIDEVIDKVIDKVTYERSDAKVEGTPLLF
jgi:hypothetical protein